ncbi:MAG: large repetitive protein, partial [Frankiales bacterium]|nr:large repetitive protein [Frankiales bacterium]
FSNDSSLYYFGQDPNGIAAACPSGCYDFQSIVLHELGHGLGFVGSVDKISAGQAAYGYDPLSGDERPFIYDLFTETAGGTPILDYANKSNALYNAVTSSLVYWDGPEGGGADRGREPRLYAPSDWLEGSSYSHLSDASYPQGDPDSLMTPFADANDITRDPGEVMLGMFRDMGWVTPALPGSTYVPLANPIQVYDSRSAVGNGALKDLVIAGTNGVPSTATAVVLNLTTTVASGADSRLFAYARPRPGAPPPARVPNLVTPAGYSRDGLATVPLGARGVRLRNVGGAAHEYVALVGYFLPSTSGGARYAATNPHRVINTRTGQGTAKARIGTGARLVTIPGLPSTAVAVALNVTAVQPSNTATLEVFNSALTTPRTGNVHMKVGQSANNLVIARLGSGNRLKIRTTLGSTDVVVELAGWYDASAPGLFRPLLPQRLFGPLRMGATAKDTRVTGDSPGFGVPANATALVLDTSAFAPTATTYLITYGTGPTPGISTLSVFKGKSSSGATLTRPGTSGAVRVRNVAGVSTVSLDLFGYYAP